MSRVDPTPITPDEATSFFAGLFGGAHHIPGDLKKSGRGWSVRYEGSMSTWDGDMLTRAVLYAHEARYRLTVAPSMRALKLSIHPRLPLQQTDHAPRGEGHPTVEEALAIYSRYGRERNDFIERLGGGESLASALEVQNG